MRILLILTVAALAGCSGNPADYGITGPGEAPAPVTREQALPGGDNSMPGATPNTGSGRFWGYN